MHDYAHLTGCGLTEFLFRPSEQTSSIGHLLPVVKRARNQVQLPVGISRGKVGRTPFHYAGDVHVQAEVHTAYFVVHGHGRSEHQFAPLHIFLIWHFRSI